jgi:hypothetical protein
MEADCSGEQSSLSAAAPKGRKNDYYQVEITDKYYTKVQKL